MDGCMLQTRLNEVLIAVPLVLILCCLFLIIIKVSRLLKVCHFHTVAQDAANATKASAKLAALLALVCDELQVAPASAPTLSNHWHVKSADGNTLQQCQDWSDSAAGMLPSTWKQKLRSAMATW